MDGNLAISKALKIYYTRPGKSNGISAGFNTDKRTFYVFTDGSCFEPNTGYSAFAVYATLEHNGDYKKATLCLSNNKKAAKQIFEVKQPSLSKKEPVIQRTLINVNDADFKRIVDLAQKLFLPERMYTDTEIVEKIQTAAKLDRRRAEKGFYLMAELGAIEETLNPTLFYLGGSTPF